MGKELIKDRQKIDIELIDENSWNPNAMKDGEFNALCKNIEEIGIVGAIQVVEKEGRFLVIGGAHRLRAAKVLGYKEIRCDIFDEENFDEDLQRFQTVRLNVIKGKMSPQKFTELVDSLGDRYTEEMIQEMMGFADEEAFGRLYRDVNRNLPADLRKRLAKSKNEIKTIDDLSSILNVLFSTYGDTLKWNFMFFTWGGKKHIMVQCHGPLKKKMEIISDYCSEKEVDINKVFEVLLNKKEVVDLIEKAIVDD